MRFADELQRMIDRLRAEIERLEAEVERLREYETKYHEIIDMIPEAKAIEEK